MDEAASPAGSPVEGGGGSRDPEEIRREIEHTREEMGDTVEALAAKTDVKGQAQAMVDDAKGQAQAKVEEIRHTAQERKDEFVAKAKEATPESAGGAAEQVRAWAQANPLAAGVAGGALAGFLLGRLTSRS